MTVVKCPTCEKNVEWDKDKSPWRPFCSERCKLIDLGQWADEQYVIRGEEFASVDDENILDLKLIK